MRYCQRLPPPASPPSSCCLSVASYGSLEIVNYDCDKLGVEGGRTPMKFKIWNGNGRRYI